MQDRILQVPPRASKYYPVTKPDDVTEPIIRPPKKVYVRRRNIGPFIWGMLFFLCIILAWILFVIPWWNDLQAQWHYGDAKVTTLVADVGHGGQSQFLAFDYQGQVTVIEIVGQRATIYKGAFFVGSNRFSHVVMLSIQDVNRDGKPDLVIQVVGMSGETVLFNTSNGFSWTSK